MPDDTTPSGLEMDEGIYLTRDVPPGSRDKVIDAVAKTAYTNNRTYEGCSRCVLAALNQHLRLSTPEGIAECIKASTGLSAGVARMGETCGAMIGAVMAIGLEYGSDRLDVFDRYVQAMQASKALYQAFQEQYGSVVCREIQHKLFGRTFDFNREEDREAWYRERGLEKCPGVCAAAARLAAGIILDGRTGPR